jgi:DNA-directed RNA polymerase specialized sigma24 family protein
MLLVVGSDIRRIAEITLNCFNLTELQRDETKRQVTRFFDDRLQDIVKAVTLALLVPAIQEAAFRRFLAKGILDCDADGLAGIVGDKVLRNTIGGWPNGNPGAWVASIGANLQKDHCEKTRMIRRKFGNRRSSECLNSLADPSYKLEELHRRIRDMDERSQEIIKRRILGDDWPLIAESLALSEEEVKGLIQRDWPGESSPISRKKRRNDRSCWR